MFRYLRKKMRPLWMLASLGWAWSNRTDVARWARFGKRMASSTTRPAIADAVLEARVRAALTADPQLRHDASVKDVRVQDGVVTVETTEPIRGFTSPFGRLEHVKGVLDVRTADPVLTQVEPQVA